MRTRNLVIAGIAVSAIAGLIMAAAIGSGGAGKRREFARSMANRFGDGAAYTEGDSDDVLVVDLRDCTPQLLESIVKIDSVSTSLSDLGFTQMKCTNGVAVAGPWDSGGTLVSGDPWSGTEP